MRRAIRIILYIASFAVLSYAAAGVGLYFHQDKITFHPSPNDPQLVKDFKEQFVAIHDGGRTIEGWWIENPNSRSERVILYFGGNGEDVLRGVRDAPKLDARGILLTNYRGFGATPGKPSQKAFFEDALSSYDYLVKQRGVASEQIVAMGKSMGSGVATYLAANRPLRGVILITPYDSIAAIAQEQYPWFPVRPFLRNPFPSDEYARNVSAPVTIVAGGDDTFVSAAHAQKLYDAWHGPKEIWILKGAGHNNIDQHPDYYETINAFLAK